jgi:short-subunit dehydrogenase
MQHKHVSDQDIYDDITHNHKNKNQDKDIIVIPCDLRNPWAPQYILDELKERGIHDKIDVLINNAGLSCH